MLLGGLVEEALVRSPQTQGHLVVDEVEAHCGLVVVVVVNEVDEVVDTAGLSAVLFDWRRYQRVSLMA